MGLDGHWHSYHMLLRQNFDPIWSKLSLVINPRKRPPRLDILGGRLQEIRLYRSGVTQAQGS